MGLETALKNLKEKSEENYIEEYNDPYYKARELYDRKTSLKKTNFVLRRLMKNSVNKEPVKTISEYEAIYLIIQNNVQIKLIKFTQSMDGTSDKKETIFTGGKAVWYDRPFRELIDKYYTGDINDFYLTIDRMKDEIKTSVGKVPKNLALQFIQNLRLIVSEGSRDRADRGIFKIHHDLQIAPTHVVIILEALGISCRPQCVMKRSENEYERGNAPDWLISLADKPHERDYSVEELTDEEKRVFAKVKKTQMIVMEGGCTCGHSKGDHNREKNCMTGYCECVKFKLRINTKRVIEV